MSYDGLVTTAMVNQLQNELIGGRINKIYQPEKDALILHIHQNHEKKMLYISANGSHARMHLCSNDYLNPENPPSFCMLLRKYLQNGRINDIYQVESERIVEIVVDHYNEIGYCIQRKLIIEIMGKHSNIIATDLTTNKIIDSIKRIPLDINRYRQTLPGLSYVSPPSQGKISYYSVTEQKIDEILRNKGSIPSKALVSGIQGISPTISLEICLRASKNYSTEPNKLTGKEIYPIISDFVTSLESKKITPIVYLDKAKKVLDFHIFNISEYEDCCEKIIFNNISEAISFYFSNKISSNLIRQKSADLIKTIKQKLDKLYLKKQRLSEDLLRAKKGDDFRLYGELLTANLYNIQSGDNNITVINYYNNQEVKIALDPRFTASQNAQLYFKKYNKAKTAIKEKNIQLAKASDSILYLESVLSFTENVETLDDIEEIRIELIENSYLKRHKKSSKSFKSNKTKLKTCTYFTSDGFQLSVGRNNKENDRLTFKIANKNDLWFHTKDIPGSHVILHTKGKKIQDNTLLEAAGLAAYYSKARFSENVPVDYTLVQNVQKPSGAKPGMVIFNNNNTLYVTPSILKREI